MTRNMMSRTDRHSEKKAVRSGDVLGEHAGCGDGPECVRDVAVVPVLVSSFHFAT